MLLTAAAYGAEPGPHQGGGSAKAGRDLAARFDAELKAEDQIGWLKRMAAEPNHVGSPHDKANAEFMLAQFKAWGWDARIETFKVLYPTLKHHALELTAPTHFTAGLAETPVAGDESSRQIETSLPPYHAYGGDGDVNGKLVYVNYGMPDDYKLLARLGVDVAGKIVIARYGHGWRGLKPKLAQQHGALGCIVYSDPRDDGYFQGEIYPAGAFRPPQGVQRGSVADMPIYSGDPLTPGIGATDDAPRLKLEEAKTILKIPVLPVSYGDAQPLLAALGGEVAPTEWRGALPITYHVGPGPAEVHLEVHSDWNLKTIYDVIATMRGSEYPDQWVMRGNHHDGWVFGATDPLSGNSALMSEVKALGALAKQGWRPKRTLVYASWDAEEPGLIGSTEWAETHADELQHKLVLYINTDSNSRGFFSAAGSHAWQHLVNEVADDVSDPETGAAIGTRLRAKWRVDGLAESADADTKKLARAAAAGGDLPIEALGSGSDFTPFLQHLGIASLNLGFGGEGHEEGVYHSLYDSFEHHTRFVDPDARYGLALARITGRIVLRVADAELLPMRFTDMADTVAQYVDEVRTLSNQAREHGETLAQLFERDAFRLAADPTHPMQPPPREDAVPFLDLAPLDNAAARLKNSAKAYDAALAKSDAAKLGSAKRTQLNSLLQGMEQALLTAEGLPGRGWYRHLIYAPGIYTGYGVKTLPAVREAIEQRDWNQANQYAVITARVIDAYSARLEQATAILAGG
jgi:N-acetylated-alpha-linked acidic dipeptidase